MFRRRDNRQWDQLRPIKFTRNFTKNADGSVLVEFGDTRVFTTAKVEERVPAFLMGKGEGWITAEYSLLPGSTLVRSPREVTRGQPSGRCSLLIVSCSTNAVLQDHFNWANPNRKCQEATI